MLDALFPLLPDKMSSLPRLPRRPVAAAKNMERGGTLFDDLDKRPHTILNLHAADGCDGDVSPGVELPGAHDA